jgi:5-methylcytosine-specific restriction endonuclease McrA
MQLRPKRTNRQQGFPPVVLGRKADESRRNRKWRLARQGRATDLRERLIRAFGPRCQYCGEYGDETGIPITDRGPGGHYHRWTADRIDPAGPYDPLNVTLACNLCNARKGHSWPDFPVPSLAMMEPANEF